MLKVQQACGSLQPLLFLFQSPPSSGLVVAAFFAEMDYFLGSYGRRRRRRCSVHGGSDGRFVVQLFILEVAESTAR
jgi:hypothetical protein